MLKLLDKKGDNSENSNNLEQSDGSLSIFFGLFCTRFQRKKKIRKTKEKEKHAAPWTTFTKAGSKVAIKNAIEPIKQQFFKNRLP